MKSFEDFIFECYRYGFLLFEGKYSDEHAFRKVWNHFITHRKYGREIRDLINAGKYDDAREAMEKEIAAASQDPKHPLSFEKAKRGFEKGKDAKSEESFYDNLDAVADAEAQYHNLLIEGRGGPSYNYEEAYIKLFNHLVKGDKLGVTNGKILRNLVANQDIDGLTDFLAQELNNIKNNKKHPLHFNNIANDDPGFTGKSGKTDAHRDSYYREIEDHFYTFLNDSQSRVGKSMVVNGYVVRRMGEDKIPLSKSGKEDYGKDIDTSKVDIEYYNPRNPKQVHRTSLKKKSGSVLYSAGPKETVGNYKSALRAQLAFSQKTGAITPEQAKQINDAALEKIELLGVEIENTRNKTKEEQEDALGIINGIRDDIENLVPGIIREVGLQAASGQGKFDKNKVVQTVLSTGPGGGRTGDIREIGADDRARKTKHPANPAKGKTTSGSALTAGDNRPAISGEPASYLSTSLQSRLDAGELTFDELQKNIEKAQERISAYQTKLDDDGYDEKTSENLQKAKDSLSTYQIFQQKVKKVKEAEAQKALDDAEREQAEAEAQHAQTAAELEQQANQANINLSAAQAEVEKANDPSELRYSDGTKPLEQNKKRFQDFITRNPTDPSVKKIVQARQSAEDQFAAAQTAANDATVSYQTHISTPPTIQPPQPQQPQQPTQTAPQQPVEKKPTAQQPPAPQAAPEQPPAPQSTSQQPAPEQPAPEPQQAQGQQQVTPQPEQKKKKQQKPPVEITPE